MKTVFLTESELMEDAYQELGILISGGNKNDWEEYLEKGYIPDLFSCDPDKINYNDNLVLFMDYKIGDTRFILHTPYSDWESDELPTVLQNALIALFDDNDKTLIDLDNTWSAFYANDAIAYRGGKGYSYSIWGIPETINALGQQQ